MSKKPPKMLSSFRGVLYIGDNYEADVVGAWGVGTTPILLDRRGKVGYQGVICIGSLAELVGD